MILWRSSAAGSSMRLQGDRVLLTSAFFLRALRVLRGSKIWSSTRLIHDGNRRTEMPRLAADEIGIEPGALARQDFPQIRARSGSDRNVRRVESDGIKAEGP